MNRHITVPGVPGGQVAAAGRRVAVDARAPVQAQFDGQWHQNITA